MGRAEDLYNLIDRDPDAAEREAVALAGRAESSASAEAEALAWRAAAVAARGRDVDVARSLASRGLAVADAAGLADTADRIRVTLAGIDVFAGRHAAARDLLEAIVGRNRGRAAAEALTQLGFLELLAGEFLAAIARFDRAIPRLGGDGVWVANTHSNRGLARAYAGDLSGAERDLKKAIDFFVSLGATRAIAESRQNLGWVMDQAGDYVGALQAFTQAEQVLSTPAASHGYLLKDRATTLIAIGLAEDAAEDARQSADEFMSAGRHGDAAESMAVQAMALVAVGRRAEARLVAATAEDAFRSQGRPIHADHAALIGLKAIPSTALRPRHARRARELASRLDRRGAGIVALDAALTAARIHLLTGDRLRAVTLLAAAALARRSSRPDLRLGYWQVTADLRASEGDRAGVLRAARAGLDVVDRSQRLLGSTEARVNMAAAADRLGRAGLVAARDTGAARLFDWMERVRAGSLRFRPVRPDTSILAGPQASLRSLAREVEDAQLNGNDIGDLVKRQADLERSIRLRMLETRGSGEGIDRARAGDVRDCLGDRVLVAYAEVAGRLVAVRLDRRRARSFDLGDLDAILTELDHLRFGLLRVATGRGSAAISAAVETGASRLDEMLLAPVDTCGAGLILVPIGRLFAMPWSLLPTTSGTPITVAPSASLWMAARRRRRRTGSTVLAAGPDLEHAWREIGRIARIHPEATRLAPSKATGARMLEAAEGAELMHVACHGVFRSDNPLFSHLQLVDGPLSVHELEGLRSAPSTVVLSACDSGLAEPRPGNEWMGMATALLTLGTKSLVASVMPVPDAAPTIALMERMHRGLVRGVPVPEALAEAVAGVGEDPGTLASRAAFVCMGS